VSRPKARRRMADTFTYAFAGLRYATRTQRTFRIHLGIAAAIAVMIFVLDLSAIDAAVVVLAIAVVIAAELFNTGIEAVIDLLVERNHHSAAQIAKDISAGSVLTTTVAAAIVGSLVLGPPLMRVLGFPPALAAAFPRWLAAALLAAGAVGFIRLLQHPRDDSRPAASDAGTPKPGAQVR